VSPRQLAQSDFVLHLRDALFETGAAPDSLVVEVDEACPGSDLGLIREVLGAIRDTGVRLGLRDAGVGIRALGHVFDLGVGSLRLDPYAPRGLGDSRRGRAVLEHVVGLARSFGVTTIAADLVVDTERDTLVALGCELG